MIDRQMTIFDYVESFDPIRRVAEVATPYWTSSKETIVKICDTDPDIKSFAHVVRHEFCPYGYAGGYGCDRRERNDLLGYTMKPNHIIVCFFDQTGKEHERIYSWEDFAREIADMIWRGEWREA